MQNSMKKSFRSIGRLPIVVIVVISCLLIINCSKKQTDCIEGGKPSGFWANYPLPVVEGSEFCRENTSQVNRAFIGFVKYGDTAPIDLVKPFQEELKKKGWQIEGVNLLAHGNFIYANNGSKRMVFELGDCFDKGFLYKPCTKISMIESDDRFIPAK